MKRIFVVCLALGWSLLFCACGKDDSPSGPGGTLYRYENYVHFDTSVTITAKFQLFLHDSTCREAVLNWEQSLGEPFFDLDSNGVYEPGIDSFVVALDPAINQDLNRNNRYDGPDDPWEPGIPFDDINGDGTYDPDTLDIYSGYEPGMPFCDFNENGVRDSGLSSRYAFVKWRELVSPPESLKQYYALDRASAMYRFTSDSGLTYDLPFAGYTITFTLVQTDTGLYDDGGNFILLDTGFIWEMYNRQIEFKPALHGAGTEEDGQSRSLTRLKTVDCGASFTIDDLTFSDLVMVRNLIPAWQQPEGNYGVHEYYFSRQHGLLARGVGTLLAPPAVMDTVKLILYQCYYKSNEDDNPLVFPMTR